MFHVFRQQEGQDRRRREIRYSREVNEAVSAALDRRNASNIEAAKGSFSILKLNDTTNSEMSSMGPEKNERVSIKNGTFYQRFYQEVNVSTLSFVIKDLRHYSMYTISVQACRESVPDDLTYSEKIENCSTEVIVHQRTKKIGKINMNSFRQYIMLFK